MKSQLKVEVVSADTSNMRGHPIDLTCQPARSDRERGFTLVEILIVIVILGVLATVTVFAVRGVADRGEDASCDTDYDVVLSSAAFYMAQNGLAAIPATGAVDGDEYERTLVDAGVLQAVSSYHTLAADGTITSAGDPCP